MFCLGQWRSLDFRGQVGNPIAPIETFFVVLRVSGDFLHIISFLEVRAGLLTP